MLNILTMLFCLLLVFVPVVAVHEFGHYLVARLCGVPATRFSIGFGPKLCGYTDKKGTYWCLSLIPLGGYVAFYESDDEEVKAGTATAFSDESPLKRLLIAMAGPVSNFVMAVVILTAVYWHYGTVDLTQPTPIKLLKVADDSPAAHMGLRSNDIIVALDDFKLTTMGDFSTRLSSQWPQHLTIMRDGVQSTLSVPTAPNHVLGVYADVPRGSTTLGQAFVNANSTAYDVVAQTLSYLKDVVWGKSSADQFSGPIGMASQSRSAYNEGGLFLFMALVSLGLGVTNALPLPLLDGGHVLIALYQLVVRRAVSLRFLGAWQIVGVAIFLFLTGFTMVLDLANVVKVG